MTARNRNLHHLAALLAVGVAATLFTVDLSPRGDLVLGGRDAEAVVGRPATPGSYAGVARRTSRRTTRRAYAYGAGGAYYAPPAGVVYALPGGCAPAGGGVYVCGSARYQAYYDGPNLVYRPI